MRINTNLAAINTQRNLASVQSALGKSVERLSSGLRINRAGDDAAGLTISEKLRGQVKGLNQAVRNAQDGISMIQTAEGGLNESHAILQRMRELAVQGANETLTQADRKAIGDELTSLTSEVDRIANTTEFNTKKLLNGQLSSDQVTLDDANSDLEAGTALAIATNISVSATAVDGAKANTTYTFAEGANADEITLSDGAGNSQTLKVADMAVGESQTLSFGNLGVSITLATEANANAGNTAANIVDGLDNNGNSDFTLTTNAATADRTARFQVGANADQTVSLTVDNALSTTIGAVTGGPASLSAAVAAFTNDTTGQTTAQANNLIKSLDEAIANVSKSRSNLGAVQNRLEHTIENLAVSSENLSASESRIRDADMAAEMVGFTRSNILQQAGTSILAQANQLPQGVLSLLR